MLNIDVVKPKKGTTMETIGRVEGLQLLGFRVSGGLGVFGLRA